MPTANDRIPPELEMLYQRLLRLGLSYGDFSRLKSSPLELQAWASELALLAKRYEDMADEAWERSRTASAAQWWRKATDYYHYAQMFLPYSPAKLALRKSSQANFLKLLNRMSPSVQRLEIPFQSITLPGYLRTAAPESPIVILINGLDSSKETELFYFAETFAKRGISTLCLDAPGQGELLGAAAMRPNIEVVISTVIDFIVHNGLADPRKIGLFGVSFGGHLAARAAACDERVKACICLGSFFDSSGLAHFNPVVQGAFRAQYGAVQQESLDDLYEQLSLEPFAGKMISPLLVVHGSRDHIFAVSEAERIHAWGYGPKELWILDNAEHVCSSCFDELLPRMGDWMAQQLA